jgi:hypothetical protein
MAVYSDARRFYLPVGDPHSVHSDKAEIAKHNIVAPCSVSGHIASLNLPAFYTFRT